MLSAEKARMLTETGPGTPAGDLMRRYWQPVALVSDLPPDGGPLPVMILSEELVVFRDDAQRIGVIALRCSHRGCDLSYGRVENGGLRCVYHGWLFDAEGRCLEQPGEPAGSTFHLKVKHPAYPACERAGVIFAYFGPGAPPELAHFEFFTVGEAYRVSAKLEQDCNYLQGVEGNIDPTHQSFLHRFLGETEDTAELSPVEPVGGTTETNLSLYRKSPQPRIDIEDTAFGARFLILRDMEDAATFLRIYNFVLPNSAIVPGPAGADGYTIHWHVPIDDEHHWKFVLAFTRSRPIDRERFDRAVFPAADGEGRRLRTRENRYLQNRAEMKDGWYAGVGGHFSDHDNFANEAQGKIQDRTREQLGAGDACIIRERRLLFDAMEAIAEGRVPTGIITGPHDDWSSDLLVVTEAFADGEDWRSAWRDRATRRLEAAQ